MLPFGEQKRDCHSIRKSKVALLRKPFHPRRKYVPAGLSSHRASRHKNQMPPTELRPASPPPVGFVSVARSVTMRASNETLILGGLTLVYVQELVRAWRCGAHARVLAFDSTPGTQELWWLSLGTFRMDARFFSLCLVGGGGNLSFSLVELPKEWLARFCKLFLSRGCGS